MKRTLVLIALLLAACGQSGDLYLPPEEPKDQPPVTPAQPDDPTKAPSGDKDKK